MFFWQETGNLLNMEPSTADKLKPLTCDACLSRFAVNCPPHLSPHMSLTWPATVDVQLDLLFSVRSSLIPTAAVQAIPDEAKKAGMVVRGYVNKYVSILSYIKLIVSIIFA